ncbi:hypothetical protein CHARACLAT_016473 [Characodon lateralis]|uniref:Uncharacterized protein n=1 Tax=Characodon lateralis TaxID=208331 RepID=A0ABU7CR23_9TELE|nr:hypothetical protein [Characodon lateralis]
MNAQPQSRPASASIAHPKPCLCLSSALYSPRFAITASLSLLDFSSLPHQFATGPRPTHHQVIYPAECPPFCIHLLHHHHQSCLLVPAGKRALCWESAVALEKKKTHIQNVLSSLETDKGVFQ